MNLKFESRRPDDTPLRFGVIVNQPSFLANLKNLEPG
jgi:hypothetical protein